MKNSIPSECRRSIEACMRNAPHYHRSRVRSARLQAGACGYILKSDGADRIVQAVRSAAQGGAPFTPRIARMMLGFFSQRRPAPPGEALTARESEVLQLLGQGKSYRQISDQLFVSLGTTQSHVKNIYSKLHVHSRVEIMKLLKIG